MWTVDGCLNQASDSIDVTCFAGTGALFTLYPFQDCNGAPSYQGNSRTGECATITPFGTSYVVYCGESVTPSASVTPTPSNTPVPSYTPMPTPPAKAPQWAQQSYNAQHTGQAPGIGAQTGQLAWTYTGQSNTLTTPVADGAGNLYIGSIPFYMYALNGTSPSQTLLWQSTAVRVNSAPVLAGSFLVFATTTGTAALLTFSGRVAWVNDNVTVLSNPTLGPDGLVYFGGASCLFALQAATGEVVLNYSTGSATGARVNTPSISSDGSLVVFTSGDGVARCIRMPTGDLVWSFSDTYPFGTAPAISANGVVSGLCVSLAPVCVRSCV